jgi:hypothetical protein
MSGLWYNVYKYTLNSFAFLTIGVMRQKLSFFISCQMDLGRLAPASEVTGGHTLQFYKAHGLPI